MKKRILFVEDNPLLLQMYVMMLEDERGGWEVATAENGQKALDLLGRSAFDVIVSDMRMPRMSGIELLSNVREKHPGTSRIIISGLNDQEEIAGSLGSTHQFLAKPFDVKTLKGALHRICGLDAYLKDPKLKDLVGQFRALPSFPTLYVDVMRELGAEDPSVDAIAATMAKDPGMTAKMLQIVNSAAVGLSRKIGSPHEAVQFLGLSTVRSLVLSAHIFCCFENTSIRGLSVSDLWNHGMKCGRIACIILQTEQAEPADIEDAYISGMLHDIGKLMLADSMPRQFQHALELAKDRNMHLHEAEIEILGANHGGVAAYLLGLWGLPASIVEAIAFHHNPASSDMRKLGPLAAVHVANVLAHESDKNPASGRPSEIDLKYFSAICPEDKIAAWREEAARQVDSQSNS